MNTSEALSNIKNAIENAPRNGYVAELHLQVVKHSELLQNISGKEFCEIVGLAPSFRTEYAKMKKIAPRLIIAGLQVDKI